MKSFVLVVLMQSMLALQWSSGPLQKQVQRNREWQAGTYRGLTIGKSKRADVLRVLGEPRRQDTPAGQSPNDPDPEVWYVYKGAAEFVGDLTVVIEKRTGVVARIDLSPEDLSEAEAIKHFGPDYIITRYAFDECLGDEESAPLYESPNGSLLEIEYRARGIAVAVNEAGKVNTISFVSKPIGAVESKCKKRERTPGGDLN